MPGPQNPVRHGLAHPAQTDKTDSQLVCIAHESLLWGKEETLQIAFRSVNAWCFASRSGAWNLARCGAQRATHLVNVNNSSHPGRGARTLWKCSRGSAAGATP